MPKNFVIFLIASVMVGCQTAPTTTKFDGKWEFCKSDDGIMMACLPMEDVKKLRELLIRCDEKE